MLLFCVVYYDNKLYYDNKHLETEFALKRMNTLINHMLNVAVFTV